MSVTHFSGPIQYTDPKQRAQQIAVVPLNAVDTAGGIFAWANPEGKRILITRIDIDILTVATAACTLSVGVAVNGTTSAANLMDTQDVHTTATVLDNISNKGTNGDTSMACPAGQYVTGSKATGASAGLAGNAYIHYILA